MNYQQKLKSGLRFILALTCLLLAACCGSTCPPLPSPNAGKPCGELMDQLEEFHIQVIARGDTLRIILPADIFFDADSTLYEPPQFKREAEPILALVAALTECHCYGTMRMRVYGYSDTVGSIPEQQFRAYQEAHIIAAYLWSNGIPLSRITVRGYGAQTTIATNETPHGSFYNRRIEVLVP